MRDAGISARDAAHVGCVAGSVPVWCLMCGPLGGAPLSAGTTWTSLVSDWTPVAVWHGQAPVRAECVLSWFGCPHCGWRWPQGESLSGCRLPWPAGAYSRALVSLRVVSRGPSSDVVHTLKAAPGLPVLERPAISLLLSRNPA